MLRVKSIGASDFVLRTAAPSPPAPINESLANLLWFFRSQWNDYKKKKKDERAKVKGEDSSAKAKGKRKAQDLDDRDDNDNEAIRNTRYIVNANGVPVPSHVADEMRIDLRSVLAELKHNRRLTSASQIGKPASSFQDLIYSDISHIVACMEELHPELSLCDRHWKTRMLAEDNFGHWITKLKKKSLDTVGAEPPLKRIKLDEEGVSNPVEVSVSCLETIISLT